MRQNWKLGTLVCLIAEHALLSEQVIKNAAQTQTILNIFWVISLIHYAGAELGYVPRFLTDDKCKVCTLANMA